MENINPAVEEESVIDLRELFFLVLKNFWLILIITVVITIGVGLFTQFGLDKKYESSTTITVFTNLEEVNQSTETLRVSTLLAERFAVIADLDAVLVPVSEQLADDYNIELKPSQLRKLFSVSPINNLDIIKLTVTYTDPEIAAYLANNITQETIRIYEETWGANGNVKVFDKATVNDKPVSPNLLLNTVIGFIVGAILSVGLVLFKELFNRKVRSQKDVESLGITYLGNVPEFSRLSRR